MQKREFTVQNSAGIHCRPASMILNCASQEFPDVKLRVVSGDGEEAELNSILNLISLGLACGATGVLTAEGGNEEEALKKVGDLFEYQFDFPNANSVN